MLHYINFEYYIEEIEKASPEDRKRLIDELLFKLVTSIESSAYVITKMISEKTSKKVFDWTCREINRCMFPYLPDGKELFNRLGATLLKGVSKSERGKYVEVIKDIDDLFTDAVLISENDHSYDQAKSGKEMKKKIKEINEKLAILNK